MDKLLTRIGPWILIVVFVFGWYQAQLGKARAEGRERVLIEQQDSILAVNDSLQTIDSLKVEVLNDSLVKAEARHAELQKANDNLAVSFDSVLAEIPEPEVRERIRLVVDTLRATCKACDNALSYSKTQVLILQRSLNTERRLHDGTRNLLDVARKGQAERRISFGVMVGMGVYWQDGRVVTQPGVMVGVQIRVF